MTNVLQLIPFPTATPRHGGQIRAYHTRRVLEAAGLSVKSLEIFRGSNYPDDRPHIDIDGASAPRRLSSDWQIADFAAGIALASDARCQQRLAELIQGCHFDVLMLEEPWLWPAVRRLMHTFRQPIIYNSYNVESVNKRDILIDANIPDARIIAHEIENVEQCLCRASSACSAVTEHDAAVLRQWTASPVVVAPNGSVRRKLSHLAGIIPQALAAEDRYVLYVASGHPPNVAGFLALAMGALRVLRSDERIVVAGSICDSIYTKITNDRHSYITRDRLSLLGKIGDYALSCLIANAAGFILPITYGGGSNLKTAEALISGKPIVATDVAFRGYEEFKTYPTVLIANDERTFTAGIRRVLDMRVDPVEWSPVLTSLLWDSSLKPMVDLVNLAATDGASR